LGSSTSNGPRFSREALPHPRGSLARQASIIMGDSGVTPKVAPPRADDQCRNAGA